MTTTEIYLFRHAQTLWNEQKRFQGQKNSDLSDLGILQARKMAEKIKLLKPDVFITSGLKRTKETLQYALEEMGEERNIYEFIEFNEAAFGNWEGMLLEDVLKEFNVEYDTHKERPHLFRLQGAETYFEIQNRSIKGIKKILGKFPGKKVAVVTHGMVILCLTGYLRNIPIKRIREKVSIPNNTDFIKTCWYH
jgi:probable phosphoglycerate mutase